MAGTFDITFKHLLEAFPDDWLRLFGVSEHGRVEVIDVDLATVTAAQADKMFLVHDADPWIFHLEVQTRYAADLPDRTLVYNTLAYHRKRVPVRSVVLLLSPKADGPVMMGAISRKFPWGHQYLDFRYEIVRLWELPVEAVLSAGIGVLPLAPLAAGAEARLPEVIDEMKQRLEQEVEPGESAALRASAYVLMGLKYPPEMAEILFQGVGNMKESTTYQAILAEGRVEGEIKGKVEGARELLLDLGTDQFGPPDAAVCEALETIDDIERLKRLSKRVLKVSTWEELLSES